MKLEELTEQIIGAAYTVHNELGSGFLEKVYHNALFIELTELGLKVDSEKPIDVYFKKQKVGEYFADLCVNDLVILEIKSVQEIHPVHEVQLVNYLKATNIEIGLLINFGKSVEIRRRMLTQT